MDSRLIGEVGVVLVSFGAALQYLRAYKWFVELAYYGVAVVLAVLALLFVAQSHLPTTPFGVANFFVENWPLLGTFLATLMAGTKASSDAAKGGAAFIPMTNSK